MAAAVTINFCTSFSRSAVLRALPVQPEKTSSEYWHDEITNNYLDNQIKTVIDESIENVIHQKPLFLSSLYILRLVGEAMFVEGQDSSEELLEMFPRRGPLGKKKNPVFRPMNSHLAPTYPTLMYKFLIMERKKSSLFLAGGSRQHKSPNFSP